MGTQDIKWSTKTLGNFQLFREKVLESVRYCKENINVQDFRERNDEIITKQRMRKPQI